MTVEPVEMVVALTAIYLVLPALLIAAAVDFFKDISR
jgi:hypothetical protein